MPKNSTVYAIDASTGDIEWSFSIPSVPHRGGLIVSGNLVILSSLNGRIYSLDSDTGQEVRVKRLGAALGTAPTIGAAASGEQFLYQLVGGLPARFGTPVSGAIIAHKIRGGPVVDLSRPPDVGDSPSPDKGGQLPLNIMQESQPLQKS